MPNLSYRFPRCCRDPVARRRRARRRTPRRYQRRRVRRGGRHGAAPAVDDPDDRPDHRPRRHDRARRLRLDRRGNRGRGGHRHLADRPGRRAVRRRRRRDPRLADRHQRAPDVALARHGTVLPSPAGAAPEFRRPRPGAHPSLRRTMTKRWTLALLITTISAGVFAADVLATPPAGLTTTTIGEAPLPPVNILSLNRTAATDAPPTGSLARREQLRRTPTRPAARSSTPEAQTSTCSKTTARHPRSPSPCSSSPTGNPGGSTSPSPPRPTAPPDRRSDRTCPRSRSRLHSCTS